MRVPREGGAARMGNGRIGGILEKGMLGKFVENNWDKAGMMNPSSDFSTLNVKDTLHTAVSLLDTILRLGGGGGNEEQRKTDVTQKVNELLSSVVSLTNNEVHDAIMHALSKGNTQNKIDAINLALDIIKEMEKQQNTSMKGGASTSTTEMPNYSNSTVVSKNSKVVSNIKHASSNSEEITIAYTDITPPEETVLLYNILATLSSKRSERFDLFNRVYEDLREKLTILYSINISIEDALQCIPLQLLTSESDIPSIHIEDINSALAGMFTQLINKNKHEFNEVAETLRQLLGKEEGMDSLLHTFLTYYEYDEGSTNIQLPMDINVSGRVERFSTENPRVALVVKLVNYLISLLYANSINNIGSMDDEDAYLFQVNGVVIDNYFADFPGMKLLTTLFPSLLVSASMDAESESFLPFCVERCAFFLRNNGFDEDSPVYDAITSITTAESLDSAINSDDTEPVVVIGGTRNTRRARKVKRRTVRKFILRKQMSRKRRN